MAVETQQKACSVILLNKAYQFTCHPDEHEALYQSAEYLDQKMRQIQASGRVVGMERIAIMAALNLAHELLTQKGTHKHNQKVSVDQQKLDKTLQVLHNKIKSAVVRNSLK